MKDEHFDVIIADVHMPGLNGLQLLRDAKAEGVLQPRTSIIIITGDRTPSTRDEASSIGAIAVMPKPPVAADLLDALRAASESNRGISAN
jgi:two-component system sensor histidine kinase RpfC